MVLAVGGGARGAGSAAARAPTPAGSAMAEPPYPRAWGFFWLSPTISALVS